MINIPIVSDALKSRQFASVIFAHHKKSTRVKQQWKSFYLALINPRTAGHWFKLIQSREFRAILSKRPGLYLKPFRVYMSAKWSNRQKIKVILDTYRFINAQSEAFKEIMLGEDEQEILRFKINDKTDGYFTLGYDVQFRKEGEMVLGFNCDSLGGRIVSLSFSFEETEKGNWACRIGCIQGHATNDLYSSKQVQKQLHGLRPKALVLIALQELCFRWGLSVIYGAGDSIQAYRQKHAIHIHWRHSINFNYDTFWTESGGEGAQKDGWHKLPLLPKRRDIADIKPVKRSLYNKRYRMLDELSQMIAETAEKYFDRKEEK